MQQQPTRPTGGVCFLQAEGCPDDPIKIGWSGDDVEGPTSAMPDRIATEALRQLIAEKLDEIGARLGPGGGFRYWKEDVLTIAAAIEEERAYRLVRHATALVRRRLSAAIQEATSPESLAECIAEAFAEPVSDRKPRLVA